MRLKNIIKSTIINETIRRTDDPYVKFTNEYNGEKQFIAIPGYCAKLSEMIKIWKNKRNIKVPYDGPLYGVNIDDNILYPIPSFIETIVGYAGPPTIKIPNTILQQIWAITDRNIAFERTKQLDKTLQIENIRQFEHDVMRSIEPGVKGVGHSGYASEIIINIPCKMILISLPNETDLDGYTDFNLSHHHW